MQEKQTPYVEEVDTSFLEGLLGYNARRASLAVTEVVLNRLEPHQLRLVDLSILSLIAHNAGITSRQLCLVLNIQPPNLVGIVSALEKRGLIRREPHPKDGRAMGLHLTARGEKLTHAAERTVTEAEAQAGSCLRPAELNTLRRLLQKLYK